MPLPPEPNLNSTGAAPTKKRARQQFRQELTQEQKSDLEEAFNLFDSNQNGYITL